MGGKEVIPGQNGGGGSGAEQVVIHQKLQAMQINLLGTYGVTY